MCRVLGFRSAFPSPMHESLLRARNALTVQSREHPDGWGIAWYEGAPLPHLRHGTGAAFSDGAFEEAARLVSSDTVVAHVRKASCGEVRPENCHPFRYGPWSFAHNGDIAGFEGLREAIDASLPDDLRAHLRGDTDSERCFLLFLDALRARAGSLDPEPPFEAIADALLEVEAQLRALADPGAEKPSVLTFVVSSGTELAALHSGNTLWFSTHKSRCPEREGCAHFSPSCEAPAAEGDPVRHLLIASEPLSSANVWRPVPEGGVVGVDPQMRLRFAGARPARPAATPTGAGI